MQKLTIKGQLTCKLPLQQLSAIRKYRQFILEIEDSVLVRFVCSQSMCSLIDNFNVGQNVQVRFSIQKDNTLVCDKVISHEQH